jgi:hypothetical protein
MKLPHWALLATFTLAACGGGGSTGSVPTTPSSGPQAWKNTATMTLSIHLASKKSGSVRRPQYVSPSTTQIIIAVNNVNGNVPPSWVPASTTTALVVGANCTTTSATETCTVAVPAPPGVVNYTFTVSDGTNDLATLTTDETMVQGTANTLSVTLKGIVHTVSLSVPNPETPQSASGNYPQTVTLNAYDADGNLIVDPGAYANAITLTDPEAVTSAATNFSVNGGTARPSVTVNSPDDVLTLNYFAFAINTFTVATSGAIPGGGTIACAGAGSCDIIAGAPNDVTFTGYALDDAAHGGLVTDPNYGQQTVFFSSASGSQNITAAEIGYTGVGFAAGGFVISLDTTTCGSGGTAVASVSPNPGPALTFTITAQNVGVCKAKVTEYGSNGGLGYPLTNPGHTANTAGSPTHDGTFWISVTSSSIGVN